MTAWRGFRRTVTLLLAAVAVTAAVPWSAASAAAPHLGIDGRTTSVGSCVGGGEMTVVTKPAPKPRRLVVTVSVADVKPGTRWSGVVQAVGATAVPVGGRLARDGSWSFTRTVDSGPVARVHVSFIDGRRRCTVDVKRRSSALSESFCSRPGTMLEVRLVRGAGGTPQVRLRLESQDAPRSRWRVHLTVRHAGSGQSSSAPFTALGTDGEVVLLGPAASVGVGTWTATATGKQDGVVTTCRVRLAGRFSA